MKNGNSCSYFERLTFGFVLVICMLSYQDEHSHMKLSEQFKQHTIKRLYVSLTAGLPTPVAGLPTPVAGRVEVPVGRDPNNRIRMTAVAGPVNSRKARHAASR